MESQRSRTTEGAWKGAPHGSSHPSFHIFPRCLFGPLPSSFLLLVLPCLCLLLWAQPRTHNGSCSHLLWTYNVQQLCLHLTSTSFDLHKQAKVQRGEATSSRSQS